MGQSLGLIRTHDPVPEHVKSSVAPVQYTPAPAESRERGLTRCKLCGEGFGWLCYSTNCNWCGEQLCTRCCPKRYLLGDQPGCPSCTRKAYDMRRNAMLQEHHVNAGLCIRPAVPHSGLEYKTPVVEFDANFVPDETLRPEFKLTE